MNLVDFILLAAILAGVVLAIIYLRRLRKKGTGCEYCATCKSCPIAGNCNQKKEN